MDWLQIGIQIGILLVTLALAWGKFDKKIALISQRLGIIETNHLVHIERYMKETGEQMMEMKLSIARIEEHLKK